MDAALEKARTVSLVTFKKDGTAVATPVTPVVLEGKLFTISVGEAWKVKRIGRNPKVRVAPCTLGGKVTGAYADGTARVIPGAEAQRKVRAGMHARFGIVGVITSWLGKLVRSDDKRVVIEITF